MSNNLEWNKVKEEDISTGGASTWDQVKNKPEVFPPSAHKHVVTDISDFPASLPANGGNSNTVGGKGISDLTVTYRHDFWVDGDANTYYPVVIKGATASNFFGSQLVYVYRGYSESAPVTWNTATHKGGLDVKIETFLAGWGGLLYYMDILFGQTYTNVMANLEVAGPDTNTIIIWLRGGTAVYHIQTTAPNLTVTPVIGDYAHLPGGQYERIYKPTTAIEAVFQRVSHRRRIICGPDVWRTSSYQFPKNATLLAPEVVDNLTTNDATKALSAKQGMELFQSVSNGKQLIASAITGKGVSTSKDDSFQKMATNINNISTGMKYAEGSVTPTTPSAFVLSNGGTISMYRAVVTGLTFKPSIIVLQYNMFDYTLYSSKYSATSNTIAADQSSRVSGNSVPSYTIDAVSPASVTATGFTLPVRRTAAYKWYAFE